MEGGDLEFLVDRQKEGRPTPRLDLRHERGTGGFRSFKEENYLRTEWLAGSAKLQKLFCWPCLLFDRDTCSLNNPWASSGCENVKKRLLVTVKDERCGWSVGGLAGKLQGDRGLGKYFSAFFYLLLTPNKICTRAHKTKLRHMSRQQLNSLSLITQQ